MIYIVLLILIGFIWYYRRKIPKNTYKGILGLSYYIVVHIFLLMIALATLIFQLFSRTSHGQETRKDPTP